MSYTNGIELVKKKIIFELPKCSKCGSVVWRVCIMKRNLKKKVQVMKRLREVFYCEKCRCIIEGDDNVYKNR